MHFFHSKLLTIISLILLKTPIAIAKSAMKRKTITRNPKRIAKTTIIKKQDK